MRCEISLIIRFFSSIQIYKFRHHFTVVFRVSTIWQEILLIFLPQYYGTVLWQEKYYISFWALLGKKLLTKSVGF